MRQIVLDTETTGLDYRQGHRITEIGCVELIERRRTGRTFHRYLNPERDVDAGAIAITGLTREFLSDKPRFSEITVELLDFIAGSELIIHNADFDVGFLNAELDRCSTGYLRVHEYASVLDSLKLARERYPGQRNSLDALCKRLNVDNAHRNLHGALLDAQLLTDVYLFMTAGQGDLVLSVNSETDQSKRTVRRTGPQAQVRVRQANQSELFNHEERLSLLDKAVNGVCVWRQLQ